MPIRLEEEPPRLADLHMLFDLSAYLTQRLRTLQSRHNFNPDLGAVQVRPDNAQDYGAFRAYLGLVERFRLEVSVDYDPAGLTPEQRSQARQERPRFVYFFQLEEDPTAWKVGRSLNPHQRRGALQVGNHRTFVKRYEVQTRSLAEAIELERALKVYLSRYHIRGEWRNLTHEQVHVLVQRLLSGEDRSFLKIRLKG